jgi:hypothetical protein
MEITGEIGRVENRLAIRYVVTGDVDSILFPFPSVAPARKHDLWQMTCFEFFLAVKDQTPYWEFNLSPSGDWNVYAMDAYRQIGFREETRIGRIQFKGQKEAGGFKLSANLDLTLLFQTDQVLEAGVTAVIQTKNGAQSFWALAHPGAQADFHLRDSFILTC